MPTTWPEHMLSSGWNYIVVDIRWYVANDKSHGYNETDPQFSIDSFGRYLPAVNRFPSAAGGQGFKPLGDYLHGKGLKFGIHIMRGVPVIAVKAKMPVYGTSKTAADIYSPKEQGMWLHDNYTVDASKEGAQEYYNSLFQLYASWGLDFVKVDDLTSPYHADELQMIRNAIDACGRPIVFSTSPGETPVEHALDVQSKANMWRTVGDFWDSWQQLKEHFSVFKRWNQYRAFGAYPDGDMLPLGHIGIRAERGENRTTNFTKDEQFTLMTLWSVFRSPMMFGGHLPDNDAFTLSLLTNKEALHVVNHSTNNRELFNKNDLVAWTADDPQTGDKYLALFNAQDQDMAMESKAAWKSGVISRDTKHQNTQFDIPLNGAKKLYLVVTEGGDNIEWDHADWINPVLYNGKDSMKLTSVNWTKAKAGWGEPQLNLSVSRAPLIVDNVTYDNGIGTHSGSVIEYDLPTGYTHVKGMAGLDKAGIVQNVGATVQFLLFTQNPAGPVPADSVKIKVDLRDLGLQESCTITDIWSGKTIGTYTYEFAPFIRRHGAGFYQNYKIEKMNFINRKACCFVCSVLLCSVFICSAQAQQEQAFRQSGYYRCVYCRPCRAGSWRHRIFLYRSR